MPIKTVKHRAELAERIITQVQIRSGFVEKSGYTIEILREVLEEELKGRPFAMLEAMARARNRLREYMQGVARDHEPLNPLIEEAYTVLGESGR